MGRERLGILYDWRVIGPFREKGADPRVQPFPPEREIDFAKEYPGDFNVCKWRTAGDGPVVTVSPTGWVSFNYSYQDDTATYALEPRDRRAGAGRSRARPRRRRLSSSS